MSRHRFVRNMNYHDDDGHDDDYDDYDDEVDTGLTSRQAQKYMYDRNRSTAADHSDEDEDDDAAQLAALSDEQRATLQSCIDQIRDVLGDVLTQSHMSHIVLTHAFDADQSLDAALQAAQRSQAAATAKAQRSKATPPRQQQATKADKAAAAVAKKPFVPKSKRTSVASGSDATAASVTTVTEAAASISVSSAPATPAAAGAPARPTMTLTVTKAQATRDARTLYERERPAGTKERLHMVVVGHVDAGKSTLMGHTLLDLGEVTQRAMHKFEKDSQKVGKASFKYAWVLDETAEERERGITMDVGSVCFETETKAVTLLDAPGHRDFIPNMISGVTQADVALLVVDATRGEFETGFEQGGQTREHAILVRSLGVSQLCVVVNKLDTVGWSQERFDEILGKLRPYLHSVGFKKADVSYVPCSGLTGENLVKAATVPELRSWYSGPTLAKVIDSFPVPARSIDQPFRMTVTDIFKATGTGLCLAGRIETGVLAAGDKILVCPLKEPAIIKSLAIDERPVPSAFAGEHVTVTLQGLDMTSVTIGSILCDIGRPVPIAGGFQARIVVFNVPLPLTVGSPVLLHHNAQVEPASIGRLKARLDKQTGEVLKKSPRCLGNGDCALITLKTCRPVCVEAFADCKELGRVTLRVGGVTVAAGVITKVLK